MIDSSSTFCGVVIRGPRRGYYQFTIIGLQHQYYGGESTLRETKGSIEKLLATGNYRVNPVGGCLVEIPQ